MRDQFDDYEKKIMESIDREAEVIWRDLNEHEPEADVQADEELDRKVYDRIRDYEATCSRKNGAEPSGLSEEDLEALYLGREIRARREEKERRKAAGRKAVVWKRLAAGIAVLVLAAGVGVNSVGGPERVVEMVKGTFGGRESTKINSGTEEAKETKESEEEQAYQQIKDELGIEPVRIVATAQDMSYSFCEIDSVIRMAQLLYEYGDKNISYLINASYTEEYWSADIEDKKTDEYTYTSGKLNADITEYELPESGDKEYSAKFEYKGIYYQMTAIMEWEDFEEILKNLHFPT